MYVYKNHKITGPDGYNLDIIISDHGKDITMEGTDNILLERKKGKYIISHNFLEEGYVERNSIMNYRENSFSIPKTGMKNLGMGNIDFAIYSQDSEVAYVTRYKNSLSINVERKDYIIPVMIYIAVLSRRIKEKFGKLYMKTGTLHLGALIIPSLSGIFSFIGVDIHSLLLAMLSFAAIFVSSIVALAMQKKNIF